MMSVVNQNGSKHSYNKVHGHGIARYLISVPIGLSSIDTNLDHNMLMIALVVKHIPHFQGTSTCQIHDSTDRKTNRTLRR